MSDWQDNIIPAADKLFDELRCEFATQQIKHIAGALERRVNRAERGELMAVWRRARGLSAAQAALELGLAVEDIAAIESGNLKCGPEAMRPIRQALRRCRHELEGNPDGPPHFKT